jgi:LPS-assembly protein
MANLFARMMGLCRGLPGFAASNGGAKLLRLCVAAVAFSGLFALIDSESANAAAAGGRKLSQPSFVRDKTEDLGKLLQPPSVQTSDPMLLQADEMVYDNENNRVTAKGNVEIYYGNYTLLADQVIYDRGSNTLSARGNVRIKDPEGAVITSNQMTLTDDFRDGFIDALRLVTKDDTRIVAQTASREAGNVTVFKNGWFTPCKPCEDNPEKPPTWRIRATKIIHRTDEATLTYRNAFFDLWGVPVLYVPYFQSADPTVKRKSGFLMPTYGNSSRIGNTVAVPYYFALSDHYDFTFAPEWTEKAGVLFQGFWRQRLSSGGYSIDLAGVWDKGTFDSPTDGDFRGSIISKGKFALDPYYAWGWDITAETDDTFRRFYDLDSKLKTDRVSQVYLEGLHDRNYAAMRFYQTGSLLLNDAPDSSAKVLPSIDYDYIVNRPIIGGELSFNTNVMSLTSDDNGSPDSTRLVTEANWRRQMIDGVGQVYTPFAELRGDVYDVNDFTDKDGNPEDGGTVRGNAVGGFEYRYPFVATTGSVMHVVEPIGQIIGRPNSLGDQEEIPNEDARSLVFDDTILFEIDKFSGYDRIETGTRANVGGRYTATLSNGAYARAVFGESYQLAGKNEFSEQTGLATDASDYVSGLYLQTSSSLAFSAQTRFNNDTFEMERTDLGSWSKYGPVELVVNYADVTAQPGINQNEDRQEVLSTGALAVTDLWALLGSVRYDLDTDQTISDGVGLRYQDDCFMFSLTYQQTFIKDRDIEPEKLFLVNFALKYLGTYAFSTDASAVGGPANSLDSTQ